jgi:flagella basal body P-ring formation protein FlgA
MMNRISIDAVIAWALMGLFLTLLLAVPARAEGALTPTRLADHAAVIRAALIAEGASEDAEISFAAPDAIVHVAEGQTILVETVSFNRASGRFLVRARGAAGEPLIAVSGAAAAPTVLPAPARDIARGDIITEDDIEFREHVGPDAARFLSDADFIIGKEARRPLVKGAPLRAGDLHAPIIMKRGATATIVLEAPGLRLTQIASALESGAIGDLIRFRNINSGAEIRAVVLSAALAAAPHGAVNRQAALQTER